MGNTSHAVVLDGVISGTNAITSNYIKYNGGDGLRITSTGAKSGTLNIMGNTIGDGFGAGNDGHGINGQANSSNSMDINLGIMVLPIKM